MARNTKVLRYSYKSKDVAQGKFFNKNFNKTESYNSNFFETIFRNTSLIGAKFKFCNMNKVVFENCFIQGALFRKCPMIGAQFKNCIIISTEFDRASLKDCLIEDSVVLSSQLGSGFKSSNLINSEILDNYYPESDFSDDLLSEIELLRNNEFVRRSSVLHRKKGKLNTVAIKLLLRDFSENYLIKALPLLGSDIQKDFHTLSYLVAMLNKLNVGDRVLLPGPLQHRKYQDKQTETCLRTDAG